MEVRRLAADDLDSCFALRLEALQTVPTAFLSSYEEEKERGPGFLQGVLERRDDANVIFGAFREGALVGMVGIVSEQRPKSRHKAFIWGMYVAPSGRGQGLGRRLLEAAIGHARSQAQIKIIGLGVESTNVSARLV